MNYSEEKTYTAEEYLAMEGEALYRSEYHEGKVVAMAGDSYHHNLIATNTAGELRQALKNGDCTVMNSELKVQISADQNYYYPDVLVHCGEPEFPEGRQDMILNPTLIIEVLSESTEAFDRGKKFMNYRQLDSLQEYVLINQHVHQVETFNKQAEGKWLYEVYDGPEALVRFHSLDVEISMKDLYFKVDFSRGV
ncbi:MAG: Uma2 family endonuclease [Bacteroidota bacterium]